MPFKRALVYLAWWKVGCCLHAVGKELSYMEVRMVFLVSRAIEVDAN